MERIRGYMVQLTIFDAVFCESSLLELPVEVIATVLKHVKQGRVLVRVLKMVENWSSERHIHDVSQAVKIWRRADEDSPRPKNPGDASQYDVTGYRQVLDDFGKKYEVKFGLKRRLGFAQIPMNRLHTLAANVVQMRSGKVCRDAVVVPQFCAQKGQLTPAYI
jgi:hypothetical protein